ncbi:MAG: ATP-binding protein [Acidobacteria bacterium]|nr:ATP-binding protein [Acidobacteriota bacterium]
MEFVDRENELELLGRHLARRGPGMFVLYGRRRIGKTALLERAIRAIPHAAYHAGTRSTVVEELSRLSVELSRAWDVPLLREQPLASCAALVAFLEGLTTPAVLVLDELPFLVESDPALPGLLQAAWDRKLSRSALKLVFAGSSIGMMEAIFLSPGAPLFGRRTGQLKLGPLPVGSLVAAFPWRAAELLELAALFGGVPGYLQRLEPEQDLIGNLSRHVLLRGEPLYEEVPFLLREELREPRVYHAVLASIAAGARKFGEISSKVGLDRANLTRYLGVLIDLGLVEREIPVTESHPEKSRKGLYRIADPFLATWFSFVHPHRDALERGFGHEVVTHHVRPVLNAYLSRAVEPVIRDLLKEPPLVDILPFNVAASGRYWSSTVELDLVFLDETRRHAFVAEVRWSKSKVSVNLIDQLRSRVMREPAFSGLTCTYALISRAGFQGKKRPSSDERLIDITGLRW